MVSTQVAAIALTFAVHLAGAVVLVRMMFSGERRDLLGWWPRGDGRDDGPPDPPAPPAGPGGLPLPDAEASTRRLRGPGRLGPGPRRRRARPAHPAGPSRPGVRPPRGRDAA